MTGEADPLAGPGRPARAASALLPHLNAAYNLARWLVRDRTEAEDTVQEALLRALRYLPSFRGGAEGDMRPWLLRIVRNVAYARLAPRGGPDRPEAMGEAALALADPGDDPEAALARLQDRERLHRLLDMLSPELRECLVLKELEEMSYRDIAEVTCVPIGTVMSRLWRARQALMAAAKLEIAP